MKENFCNHEFKIYTGLDQITIDANFIRKFVTQINLLDVTTAINLTQNGRLSSNDIEMLTNSLLNSKKVCSSGYLLFLFKIFYVRII